MAGHLPFDCFDISPFRLGKAAPLGYCHNGLNVGWADAYAELWVSWHRVLINPLVSFTENHLPVRVQGLTAIFS
jgi:hypothetical protein